MATHLVELPLKDPISSDKRSACLSCLRRRMETVQGLSEITMAGDGEKTLSLKLEYDPRLMTLSDLDIAIRHAGGCMSNDRVTRILSVTGLVSSHSAKSIEASLMQLPGVVASVAFASHTIRVEFDQRHCNYPTIVEKLDSLGVHVFEAREAADLEKAQEKKKEAGPFAAILEWGREYQQIFLAALGGLFLLSSYIIHWTEGPMWARIALVVPAFVLCSWHTFPATIKVLRRWQFDVDVLMFVAAAGAIALLHFEEGALLLFLFAIGTGGEEMAMDKARKAIQALAKLAPETAIRRDPDGQDHLIKVQELRVDDTVVVRPFDRIPADGIVATGASAVDQAPITGESVPAEKVAGDNVFAGTINGEGMMTVKVTKTSDQSTLARVIRMVDEAQTAKSPTEIFTERVERWYVPTVMVATALLVFIPPLIWGGWIKWFYQSMAFLTAASPCALAIGTPAAILSGMARAARAGVLIKGGVHLENLGRVQVIAFDKTGTLTRGKPELLEIASLNGLPEADLLAIAAAVERQSSHPLAKAIASAAVARQCATLEASDIGQIPGKGMTAIVDGKKISVGHWSMITDTPQAMEKTRSTVERLAQAGLTTVVMGIDGRVEAVMGLADRPRENAPRALRELHALGITKTVMLTGDNGTVAAAISRQIGVDTFYNDLLPEDKVRVVRELADKHGTVAMVGDGVNDAPAMASATVGIAMGGAGTDVALETADVALMADDLQKLPEAIGISRMSRKIIVQNLWIALGVIAIVAPIAALGGASLSMAVVLHEGSTVVVVCNALRLLFYKPVHLGE